MKKKFRILCAAVLLGCFMSIPAQAAETRKEFKEAAAPVRAELKAVGEELKALQEDNKAAAASYKSMRLEKKETGTLKVDRETWKKARELRSQITAIRKSMEESTAKELRQKAAAAAKEEDFDTALDTLEQVLVMKKERLESVEKIHALWMEIYGLLKE